MLVRPRVIADRLHGEHTLGTRAGQREPPQFLGPVGLLADDRDVLAVRSHRRRILAVRCVRDTRGRAARHAVAVDVGLRAPLTTRRTTNGGEENALAVWRE